MSSEQYKIGSCTVTNASQIVIGASTDWVNEVNLPCVLKINLDGESTYSVGAINTATRLTLAANYLGSTNSGIDYMIMRSFTTNRGYWRPLQGDKDFAEILSQETIDEIDEDIAHIMSGNASVEGTTSKCFRIRSEGNAVRLCASWLTASRVYTFPDQNATLAGLSVPQIFSADQTIDADLWIRANASIDGTLTYRGLIDNPVLKTSDYQITANDNLIVASGDVTITLASASAKQEIKITNRSLDVNASAVVQKSGGDTIEGDSSLKLKNKYDSVIIIGDGSNTHIEF